MREFRRRLDAPGAAAGGTQGGVMPVGAGSDAG
jgi:hypothetical protein